jgi:glycosyltransferase involved in cell wall biosynthesis
MVNGEWEMAYRTKPHLVLLHYTAPPVVGGVEHVVTQQARLFSDCGYVVTVVAGRAGVGGVAEPAELVVIPELDSDGEGNRRVREALDSGMVVPEFRKMQTQIEQALGAFCKSNTLLLAHNVFNLHLNLPLTAALHHLLDEGALRPMIAWCHDVSRYVNPTSGAPLRSGFPWDLLRTHRSDVTYVAVSQQRQRILSHVLGCPPEQIRVIPNGIDPRAFWRLGDLVSRVVEEFEMLQTDLVLLMPTRITRAKNIKRALDIIACLRDIGAQVRLVVTGPPDPHALDGKAYFQELLALRRKLRLDRQVVFLWEGVSGMPGPLTVGPTVVTELYRVCDLVLLTSDREGFGLPVLEAGLEGKPIFTTEVPALEEFEAGSVFDIARGELPMQIARRILDWAQQDRSYRLRRQVRRDYTWSAIFERHIEPLLQECTAPAAVPV